MRPPIEYLRSVDNLNLGKVLDALPNGVIGSKRVDALKAKVAYLEGELGVSPQWRVGRMISRFPQLLISSVDDNLKPKVHTPSSRLPALTLTCTAPPAPPPALIYHTHTPAPAPAQSLSARAMIDDNQC